MPRIHLQKQMVKVKEYIINRGIEWNSLVRSIIYLICCGIMFYQVSSSCKEYYTYNTVVQIKIQKPEEQSMPAVSVCRQITVTEYLDYLRRNDKEFADRFPSQSTRPLGSEASDKGQSEEEEEDKQWNELLKMENYFDLENRNSDTFFEIIKQSLVIKCFDVRTGTNIPCEVGSEPIHSFTQKRLCITYFSKLYKNFNFSENNFNISENGTSEKEEDKESLFAWFQIENPSNDIFVYIHTSKSMPDINLYDLEMTRSRLFKNQTYGIIYSKYWVRRLEEPYTTKCSNYVSKRSSPMDPVSEFGCINQCKKRFWTDIKSDYNCTPIDLVYIKESNDSSYKICNCTVKPCDKTMNRCKKCQYADDLEYKIWSTDCEKNCWQDCYEEYYTRDMFELRDDFRNKIWQKYDINVDPEDGTPKIGVTDSQTLVFLAAKYHEEISYTHVPKTSQFDFFAMMGGLFSLWIGASVLTIYDVISVVIKCLYNLYKRFKSAKDKLGDKFNNQVKIRDEMRRNREIYSRCNNTGMRPLTRNSCLDKYY